MKIIVVAAIFTASVVVGKPEKPLLSAQQEDAPYAPSGWRPEGAVLNLPKFQTQKQSNLPASKYLPPSASKTIVNTSTNSNEPSIQSDAITVENQNAYFVVLPKSAPLLLPEVQTQELLYTYSPVVSSAQYISIPQTTVYTSAQSQAISISAHPSFLTPYVVNW